MKKVNLFLLLLALSLAFVPVAAFAQDEELTPDPVVESDGEGVEGETVVKPFGTAPDEESPGGFASKETVAKFLVAAFAVCVFISQGVNELKVRGVIEKGKAGTWVKNISLAISAINQILMFIGEGAQLSGVEEGATTMANTIVVAVVFVLGSNLVHYLGKKTGASFSFSAATG